MYWTEVKRALLYGQPSIRQQKLHPQLLKVAVRDILRLIAVGWIEALNDDVVQRIHSACQASECQDIWDEFQCENPLLKRRKPKKHDSKKQRRAKDRVAQ